MKISRAAELPGPCAAAAEPASSDCWARHSPDRSLHTPEPVLREEGGLCNEILESQREGGPDSLQLEKNPRGDKDPAQPKLNKF